jgi:NADH:ubiquinone oxidoreductase subunit 5 (subunit L)/multisubunit Na+/H+ antiporter MnhA subunit
LFAAIIACTQTDIKRVLAYSTMSQIGYDVLALGVSGMAAITVLALWHPTSTFSPTQCSKPCSSSVQAP